MRELPDHHDAELLLRLYELRREEKLRQARDWVLREFCADSLEDFRRRFPRGSKEDGFLRMVWSYWDMAASIVNHGLIKEEFFFENTTEFWMVWMKLKHLVADLRETRKNLHLFKNLEDLASKYEKWMARRAPEGLEALRKVMAETPPKKQS